MTNKTKYLVLAILTAVCFIPVLRCSTFFYTPLNPECRFVILWTIKNETARLCSISVTSLTDGQGASVYDTAWGHDTAFVSDTASIDSGLIDFRFTGVDTCELCGDWYDVRVVVTLPDTSLSCQIHPDIIPDSGFCYVYPDLSDVPQHRETLIITNDSIVGESWAVE